MNTLWGSFEINNVRLVKKMMCQFAAKNLEKCIDEFPHYAELFGNLPLYFMRFYGSTEVDSVMDAMDYAVYVYDVENIVLDNLQFMTSGQGRGFEKFERPLLVKADK
ncbi:MAG: hypothetical protein IIB78_12110 [Proteobacteria bacterium]|nr:hypothetical protein [Pseudomonadota bacterium]